MKKMKTLKKNYEFQRVMKNGKFYIGKQITIYICKNNNKENRFGIAISSKALNAVTRNMIKRKIRECYRKIEKNIVGNYCMVFLWNKKIPVKDVDFHIIFDDMKQNLRRAGALK